MKKYLRRWFIITVSLVIVDHLVGSLEFTEGIKTLALAAAALTIFESLVKPIVKLLLLPINILTLGLARWLVNIIGLYLVTVAVPGFGIYPYQFPGIDHNGFTAPQINFSLFWTYVIISFLLNLTTSLVRWLIKK